MFLELSEQWRYLKKNITNLLSAEIAQKVVKVNENTSKEGKPNLPTITSNGKIILVL